MRPLEGKVALITGGGTGIGGAIARGMVAAGASVCITGRRGPVLDDMARSLPSGSVLTCAGDISNAAEAERMVAVHGGVLEIELKDWRRALDVNLTGPFLMMKAALPSMLKAGRGSIINISSIAGLRGTPGTCSYAAAKGGLNMLSQQVAVELGPHNIRCNVVCPGAVRTPQMDESIQGLGKALDSADTSLDAIYGILSANTPLRRVGHVSELVGICNFLASDASTFVTGAVIVVDGGASAVDVNGLTLHQLPPPRSTDGSP
jgi:NAD(P)-dependent dehydrogenase (short-subunit alcohol dehydrogenase family)